VRQGCPDERGKISKALWVTETYPEALEADLHRYYGLDLVQFFRPGSGLSWRKLLALTEYLPPEGALNTAIRNSLPEDELARRRGAGDPAKAPWSSLESLMAIMVDEVRQLAWMYAQSHTESKLPRPEPLPRPGVSKGSRLRPISLEAARRIDPRLRGLADAEAQEMLNRLTGRGDKR
jgi:hypothetical protein